MTDKRSKIILENNQKCKVLKFNQDEILKKENFFFEELKNKSLFEDKKVFFIDLLLKPNVFKIAISLVLFLISIVKPEIILKAATIIINDKIINITRLSTSRAFRKAPE